MRIAVWGPLAPDEGGPAEESALLLPALARYHDVVAVVRDEIAARTVAPEGVTVVADSAYGPYGVDLDVYHLANPLRPNARTHRQVLARPGVLVLHEPSLAGLYAALCGSPRSPLLDEQARVETGRALSAQPMVGVDGAHVVDPLAVLHSPRLVAASLCSIVDSAWAADELGRRCPGAALEVVPRVVAGPAGADDLAVIFVREDGLEERLTYGELRQAVAAARAGLRRLGVRRGDRVVALAPNCPQSLVAFLATASLGAVWSSCSPDFGARAVADRFGTFAVNPANPTASPSQMVANLADVGHLGPSDQHVVARPVEVFGTDPEGPGELGLGVELVQEGRRPLLAQGHAEGVAETGLEGADGEALAVRRLRPARVDGREVDGENAAASLLWVKAEIRGPRHGTLDVLRSGWVPCVTP